ncbi:proteolipid membrane potential modulator [Nostocales cyanobacterium HT-58-2]|nr:proteolipid membrane potential modulator [Nostocales cyanobacterium HT-58-2]
MKLIRLILGLLIPPLGVFLTVGAGPTLLLNILLTLLGWLPGSIHAVWVIAKYEDKLNRGGEIY